MIGTPDQLLQAVEVADADVIFVAGGALDSASQLRRIAWQLEERDVKVVVAPSVTDISAERVRVRPVGGLPLMHIDKPRAVHASRAGKRTFDVVGSLALLVLFAPLLVVLRGLDQAARPAARCCSRRSGPAATGRAFRCFKFRSMVVDAEQRLAELHARTGYHGGLFKMEDDPRITRPGRWLRRYSIDELPQLFNVLRGEMSLVGPRPPLPTEVARYARDTVRRLRVRPGMTGLWQVSGRSDLAFERGGPARPLLRRQLVDAPGPHDPGPHPRRRARLQGRLLSLAPPASDRLAGMPTALITGVGGQDGGYLAERLLADGVEVHALSLPDDAPVDGVRTHAGDVADVEGTRALVLEVAPDEIYNLAAVSSVARSWDEPDLTARVNGLAAVGLLESARQAAGRRGTPGAASSRRPAPRSSASPTGPRRTRTPRSAR